ncbi:uncharacterized protein LOC134534548 [Bacillus rossius redtenbacheri]|uniref:uncharacterized protein LOC134534548 n=1 Tax=Bacillus rossius redtenbacheri TaxID=93214 RepID=UPI002FDF05EA
MKFVLKRSGKKNWRHTCKKNGTVERKKALERGHVDNDGVPYISVYVDGAWCKRTYGHAFNAASGVACIIGVETNGLLFIGIKNKYCYVCNQTKPGEESKQHLCYKNFSGASTAMEQEILVQGFCESENMHGLRYKFIVGDGDSSTYVKIQQNVSYGRHVVKMECANHAVKNYTGKLHKIAKDTVHPISGRKCLSQLIPRLTRAARSAISSAGRSNSNSEILRADLRNGPHHVFGDHSNCRDTYCSRKDYNEEDKVALLLPTTLWPALQMALDPLVQKADRLVGNYTTNQAERFMSLVSKFSGGKRTDVGKKGRYKRCCLASGLSHVKGPHWHASPLKKMFGRSPGAIYKKVFNTRARASERGIKRKSAPEAMFRVVHVTRRGCEPSAAPAGRNRGAPAGAMVLLPRASHRGGLRHGVSGSRSDPARGPSGGHRRLRQAGLLLDLPQRPDGRGLQDVPQLRHRLPFSLPLSLSGHGGEVNSHLPRGETAKKEEKKKKTGRGVLAEKEEAWKGQRNDRGNEGCGSIRAPGGELQPTHSLAAPKERPPTSTEASVAQVNYNHGDPMQMDDDKANERNALS